MTKRIQTQTCHPEFISGSNVKQMLKRVQHDKKKGFTLAEVLITLAIIGVVAALTIPALLSNTNEKGLNTSDSVFQRRLGEALKVMNLQGTLAGHGSTQEFVDELGRHMKIMKTCSSDKLSECFVSEFTSDDKKIEVKDLTTSKKLNKDATYDTETIGVVFGNGTRALIAYKPNCKQDQFNNSNEDNAPVRLIVPNKRLDKQAKVKLETEALSILYDLQERKNNNVYDNTKGNIRGININILVAVCTGTKITYNEKTFCYFETGSAVDCRSTNSGNPDYEYCKPTPSGYENDYWAGAKKACVESGGILPDLTTLKGYFSGGTLRTVLGLTYALYFWSSSEYDHHYAYFVDSAGGGYANFDDKAGDYFGVLCESN